MSLLHVDKHILKMKLSPVRLDLEEQIYNEIVAQTLMAAVSLSAV